MVMQASHAIRCIRAASHGAMDADVAEAGEMCVNTPSIDFTYPAIPQISPSLFAQSTNTNTGL